MGSLYAITPFTLLDYPGEVACIAWFAGCNLRCAYCHNPDMVLARGEKKNNDLKAFLEKRRGRLTSVVFSGGEATYCSSLPELARQAKSLGYKVKLDTNGSRPDVLEAMTKEGLLDYIALDYKCPASRAEALIGTSLYNDAFKESLKLLIGRSRGGLGLEVRTTFHADLMAESDVDEMIGHLDSLGYEGTYYIQNVFSYGEKTLGKVGKPSRAFDPGKMREPVNFSLAFRNFPHLGACEQRQSQFA